MYLKDAVTLLRRELPKHSTKFSEYQNIISANHLAGVVTIETDVAHGLETGDAVSIVDCKQKTPISSIVTTDGVALVTTSIPHDLTLDYEDINDQPQILIADCSIAAYNGLHSLVDVGPRTKFSFNISGSPADALDGTLLENSVGGFSGLKEVTVIDATHFSFTTDKNIAAEGEGGTVHSSFRITRAITIERFIEAYSKQLTNDWWAVITPEPITASKNRAIRSDSTDMPTKGDEYRQKIISIFNLFLMIPSVNDLSGGASFDAVIAETPAIFKSILGSGLASPYHINSFSKVIFESHQFFDFIKPYYIHQFSFSIVDELVIDDFNTTSEDVAFRDIDFDTINENNEIIMQTSIELDN